MKPFLVSCLLICSVLLLAVQELRAHQLESAKQHRRMLITHCASDGWSVSIPEYPTRGKIARIADVDVEAVFPTENEGATFFFVRKKKQIFKFTAKDLYASDVWIAIDHGRRLDGTQGEAHIAITYSDGGAIGGFHVRVFLIDSNGVRDASKSIQGAVADFRARHYCKPRGNNVSALKWEDGALLLLTEVYPTGDCGPDLGHLEGYLISVPEGQILRHMTLQEVKRYPGVCLEVDDED